MMNPSVHTESPTWAPDTTLNKEEAPTTTAAAFHNQPVTPDGAEDEDGIFIALCLRFNAIWWIEKGNKKELDWIV